MLFHPVYFGLYWIQKLEILTVSFKNIQWCGGSAPFPDYKNRVSKCLKYSFKSNDMSQWVNVKLNQSTYDYIKLYIGYFLMLCDQPILVRGTIKIFLILIIPIYRLFTIDKRATLKIIFWVKFFLRGVVFIRLNDHWTTACVRRRHNLTVN